MKSGLVNKQFWQGRRVFVTGHTGFKGTWLTHWLQEMGADVTGYALAPNTNPAIFEAIKLEKRIHHIVGDVRDPNSLTEALKKANPEIIFHMAAQPLVLEGYKNPRLTFETNVMGTVNLLEAARALTHIKTIINITTDKVYENIESDHSYKENDHLGGHDPYSSSKACSELVTSSMRRSFFDEKKISVITCRAGNVFGGGDWCDNRIIPDAMRAFSQNKPLIMRNPNSIRPWQHVLEPLRAYLMLAEKSYDYNQSFPKVWNIGPTDDDAVPVKNLIEMAIKSWGDGASWELENKNAPAPHEAKFLKLDCTQARTALNWLPLFDLKTGIELTVEWYKKYYRGNSSAADLSALMTEQLKACLQESAR
jgi:CDP-glucose 4,6-dehydratase